MVYVSYMVQNPGNTVCCTLQCWKENHYQHLSVFYEHYIRLYYTIAYTTIKTTFTEELQKYFWQF